MAHSLQPERYFSICKKPVALENAKTGDAGKAVHGEYYFLKVAGLSQDSNPNTSLGRKSV
jgi:hypothetical protein